MGVVAPGEKKIKMTVFMHGENLKVSDKYSQEQVSSQQQ